MGKRGPTPKPATERKSEVVTARIRPELLKEIERAAQESKKNVSWEINRRLDQSVKGDRHSEQRFGSRRNELIFRVAALAMGKVGLFFGGHRNKDWLNDPVMFEASVRTIDRTFDKLRPNGPIDREKLRQIQIMSALMSAHIWNEINDADPKGRKSADRLKRDLGPFVEIEKVASRDRRRITNERLTAFWTLPRKTRRKK